MKKLLLLSLSLSVLGLSACQKTKGENDDKDDRFKTLEFVKQYSTAERNSLATSITENFMSVSSFSYTGEQKVDKDNEKSETTASGNFYFNNDALNSSSFISYQEGKAAVKYEGNGIKMVDNYDLVLSYWDTGNNYIATKRDENRGGTITTKVESQSFTETSSKLKKEMTEQFLFGLKDSDAFQDKNGNIYFVTSSKEKTIETQQYGEGVKQEVKYVYTQKIYTIQDKKLVNFTNYTRTKTNRDPDTKDWYTGLKTIEDFYWTYDYKYETRNSASIDTLNRSIKDWATFDSITGKAHKGTGTGSGTEINVTNSGIYDNLGLSEIEIEDGKYEIRSLNFDLEARVKTGTSTYSYSAVAVEIDTSVRLGASDPDESKYFINPKDDLTPTQKELVMVKAVSVSSDLYQFIVNTSDYTVNVKINFKVTSSTCTIVSIEVTQIS